MCGIAGFFGRFEPQTLERMDARIAHRGPDGHGTWLSADKRVGLAHRRLSIIDLSTAANQPMRDASGQVHVTYNGELYNYRELRDELIAAGIAFRTKSDTEVLLNMYMWKGADMLSRLNGIFAFAIWDERSKSLFAARDNVGVKPFYYTSTPDGFLFASEIKAFLDVPGVDWSTDPVALRRYMTYLWSPGEATLVKSVRKLLPGHALIARDGKIERIWRYYDLPYAKPPAQMTQAEAIELAHDQLKACIARQMVADVPVGAFLSGGLDSSSVVAFAKKTAKGSELPCFTIRFDKAGAAEEGIDDDLPYAHRAAKHLGVQVEEVTVGPNSLAMLPSMVYMLDEPQADVSPINSYLICAAARQAGIKVLLSGMGGDDIFTGYRRHYALEQEKYWRWLPRMARAGLASAARLLPVRIPLARQVRKAFSFAELDQQERIASYFYWGHPNVLEPLLAPDLRAQATHESVSAPLLEALGGLPSSTPLINQMLYLDGRFFVPDHNLNFIDKTSMACGVECRVPLLDIELIASAASLPVSVKQVGAEGKWVFKKAMEPYLPRDIIYRKKTGFGMPLRAWMKSELGELLDDLLSHETIARRGYFDPKAVQALRDDSEKGLVDGSYLLLSMMNIELWSRIFLDRSLRPSI